MREQLKPISSPKPHARIVLNGRKGPKEPEDHVL
jgi:hypothetical protein